MLTLPVAGLRIQRELTDLEENLNTAIVNVASLLQTCAATRNLPDVPATAGQPVLLRLASVTQHLVQAAGDVSRVHGDLAEINRDLEVVMVPDPGGNCPPAKGVADKATVAA